MTTSRLGAFIATSTPPEEIGPLAARIEQLGFGEVWVAEDYFCYGGFTAALAALNATRHIRVGLGVLASVARHPAVTAMEIATIARMHPGRFLPGIGHGVPAWTDQMAATAKSPLSALREAITGIRALLAGETVDSVGKEFTYRSVALAHAVEQEVPLLTGVIGPKSLRLSGEIADGTVMSVLAGAKYLESAVQHIAEGRAIGGRVEHQVPTFALFSTNADREQARRAVRGPLAGYLAAVGPHNPLSGVYGYNDHLAELLPHGVDHLTSELPGEWIDDLAVAGNPEDITHRVRALLDAGATSVVLSPVNAATANDELELVAREVIPNFA